MNESINQSINQPTNQPINQCDKGVCKSINSCSWAFVGQPNNWDMAVKMVVVVDYKLLQQ